MKGGSDEIGQVMKKERNGGCIKRGVGFRSVK